MELTHVQLWGEMLKKYEGIEPELLFGLQLTVEFKFQENKEYVRGVLDQQRDLREIGPMWVMKAQWQARTPWRRAAVTRTRSGTAIQPRCVSLEAQMQQAVTMDKLSEFLMVEQGGLELYRVAAARSKTARVKAKYEEFGRETAYHRQVLLQLITQLGGDPDYVSPTARLSRRQ